MKFTRLPDEPTNPPAKSRKLPPLKPIQATRKGAPLVDKEGKAVTTIVSVEAPDDRARAFLSMTCGLLATVLFGGLTLLVGTSSAGSRYPGLGVMAILAYLLFGLFSLMGLWHFLKGAFRYLAVEPESKR